MPMDSMKGLISVAPRAQLRPMLKDENNHIFLMDEEINKHKGMG